ncbi:MAG: L-2-amino-thiazoline-4-carboxylic acid hydrolase [Coriobacteriia bacterium]
MDDDTTRAAHSDLAAARNETRAAFENRALMYSAMLDTLESELGLGRATELMKRAIYQRGIEVGRRYADAVAVGDLSGVADLFVSGSPCEGSLFEPSVAEDPRDGRVVLQMTACPLVDAWRDAGYPPERVDLLCEIAAAVDYGTFEGAGLDLEFLERLPSEGCRSCRLELKLRD